MPQDYFAPTRNAMSDMTNKLMAAEQIRKQNAMGQMRQQAFAGEDIGQGMRQLAGAGDIQGANVMADIGAYQQKQQGLSKTEAVERLKLLGPVSVMLQQMTPEQRAQEYPAIAARVNQVLPGVNAPEALDQRAMQGIKATAQIWQSMQGAEEPASPYEGLASGYETYLRANQLEPSSESYSDWQQNVLAQKKAGATKVTQTVGGEKLTPGQKKIDENYAAQFIEWEAAGGYADSQKLIGQLEEVSTRLGSGTDTLTGPVIGSTPDAVLKFTNPEALDTRELVEEVVQRNLRAVLGAQFTEKEGERLIKRAYNPNLSEAQNKKRVDSLITQMKLAAEAKDSAAQYMREKGTLRGWSGRHPKMADFFGAIEGKNKDYGVVSRGQEVTTQAQYDQLPPGAIYVEDGQRYRKP